MRTARNINIVLVAVLGLLALFGTAEGSGPTEGLISHWKFDEGQGNIAYDSAGNNDGTIFGAEWTTGIFEGALSFDGDGDYINVAHDSNFNIPTGASRTFAFWFKDNGVGSLKSNAYLFIKWNLDGDWVQFCFVVPTNRLKFQISVGGTTSVSTTAFEDGAWHHAVVVTNSGTQYIYIDGILEDYDPITTQSTNNNPLKIGGSNDIANRDFNGTIDDVRIYNRALSAEEVEQLYEDGLDKYELAVTNIQRAIAEKADVLERIDAALEEEWAAYSALEELLESGDYGDLKKGDIGKAKKKIHSAIKHEKKPKKELEKSIKELEDALAMLGWEPPFPVSHWTLDEGEGDIAYDSAGDNDGIVFGALWTTGIIDGALSFDGDGDYINVAHDSNFNIPTGASRTFAFWFKDNGVGSLKSNAYLFIKWNLDGDWVQFCFDSTNHLKFQISVGGTTSVSTTVFEDGAWHHAVVVTNSETQYIYIDGILEDDDPITTQSTNNNPLKIGGSNDIANRDFNGTIDDVRIYDRALSSEEVRLLYYNRLD